MFSLRRVAAPMMSVLLGTAAAAPAGATPVSVDAFEDARLWSAHPADGVRLLLASDAGEHGRALRLDFDFQGGGGYAVARRELSLDLPQNYAFTFRIRGQTPPNHLEFKLIDSTGSNVWWSVKRDFQFPKRWETVRIRKRHVQFAWGPAGGGEIRHVAALEIAITAGSGGSGSVWFDDLEIEALAPPDSTPPAPRARASSETSGHEAARVLDGDLATDWESSEHDPNRWLELDLGPAREYGGLTVHWAAERHATDYDVEASDDHVHWRLLRKVKGGNGGRDDLFLPESESRWLRIRAVGRSKQPVGIRELVLRPLEWSASRNAFFEAIARESPRGRYPRAFSGEQSFWTLVGIDGDGSPALLDEDGRLETGVGRFSIEPFLETGGQLLGWNDVSPEQSLQDGWIPIPTVRWPSQALALEVTACGVGRPGQAAVVARYRVTNRSSRPQSGTLFLAMRPFQVNPPSQLLNDPGGTTRIRSIDMNRGTLRANGERAVVSLVRPARFGATTFDAGEIVADHLSQGHMPEKTRIVDDFEAASAAWAYPFELASGAVHEVDVWVPLHPKSSPPSLNGDAAAMRWVDQQLEAARVAWSEKVSRFDIQAPRTAAHAIESLRSQLAYILLDRAGPAIRPGSRAYARSWIRDGALTSAALLRVGHADVVREFIDWYSAHQYANGKIPCVVDRRGADPVPEHDSSGEFIFVVAEYHRLTGDRDLSARMLPRVLAAATYLDSLRQQRRTPEYAAADKREFYGLLPPSISHEGYSAKPMHSYWDDFWAARGFRDAAFLAGELGHDDQRTRLEAIAAQFESDVANSVRAAMQRHGIDYIPGCADLGDFDATSTTIALAPTGAADFLPPEAVRRTFEKYDAFFKERAAGAPWDAFTPYEIRNIGAYVRLGWRERAEPLLDFFLDSQRPVAWRQWPEVVWRELRTPRFLGDLPHTWVGSDYIRSMLDLFAYERDRDSSLVLGAGIPAGWLVESGVQVRDLVTRWGKLGFSMHREGDSVVVRIEEGLRVPPGGIVIRAPHEGGWRQVTIDGREVEAGPSGEVVVKTVPATIRLR